MDIFQGDIFDRNGMICSFCLSRAACQGPFHRLAAVGASIGVEGPGISHEFVDLIQFVSVCKHNISVLIQNALWADGPTLPNAIEVCLILSPRRFLRSQALHPVFTVLPTSVRFRQVLLWVHRRRLSKRWLAVTLCDPKPAGHCER